MGEEDEMNSDSKQRTHPVISEYILNLFETLVNQANEHLAE